VFNYNSIFNGYYLTVRNYYYTVVDLMLNYVTTPVNYYGQ